MPDHTGHLSTPVKTGENPSPKRDQSPSPTCPELEPLTALAPYLWLTVRPQPPPSILLSLWPPWLAAVTTDANESFQNRVISITKDGPAFAIKKANDLKTIRQTAAQQQPKCS